jgi:hypothetical protein
VSAAFVLALFPAAARGQDRSTSLPGASFDPPANVRASGRPRLVAGWFVVGVYVRRPPHPPARLRGASLAGLREPRPMLTAATAAPERTLPRLPVVLESPADPAPASRSLGWMLAARPRPGPVTPAFVAWVSPPPAGPFDVAAALAGPEPAALVWDRRVGRLVREGAWWPEVSRADVRADAVGAGRGLTSRFAGFAGTGELGWSVGGGAGVERQPSAATALDSDAPLPPDPLLVATGLFGASAWVTRRLVDERLSLTGGASWLQIFDADTAALAGLVRARYVGAALRFSPIPALATGIECQVGAREGRAGALDADGRVQMSTRIRF